MHDLPPDTNPNEKQPRRPAQPYLDWALATGFSYLREGNWIPLLIEFNANEARRPHGNEGPRLTALAAFATRHWLSDDPRTLDNEFIIPQLFAQPPAVLQRASNLNFCVGLIKRDPKVVRRLTQLDGWNRTILRVELGPPINFADKTTPAPSGRRGIGSRTIAADQRGVAYVRSWFAGSRAAVQRRVAYVRSWFAGSRSTGSASAGAPPPPPPPTSTNPPGTPGSPSPGSPPSVPPPGQSPGSRAGGGSAHQIDRVVIAVIDQGIAFANSRFFTGVAPRIEYLWQQNVLGTTMPAPSLTMLFTPGFELDKAEITNAVAAAKVIGADDEWVYRNYGGLSFAFDGYKPLARRRTHGTHVLDLAASVANPAKHPIIAVDMPEDAVGDPAGSTLSVQAAWGLIYILDRAEKVRNKNQNEKLPVVVNISYGPHEGPHDGTSLFEAFMDDIWELAKGSDTPLEIVLAAGNFRQTRTHAAFDLVQPEDLLWRLQPGSLTPSLMEIWLPRGIGHSVTVKLTPPVASATLRPITVSAGVPHDVVNPFGSVLYDARYVPASGIVKADSIVLSIARTAPDPAGTWGDAVAPSGLWQVKLTAAQPINGMNAWIRRSDTLSGRRAQGRQSYFDDPAYRRFAPKGSPLYGSPLEFDPGSTSYVQRRQTLSGIATGEHTLVVGGHRRQPRRPDMPAAYSSMGPEVSGGSRTRKSPTLLAPSDDSLSCRGLLAAGTRSGSVVAMNGTSVAAPVFVRWLVDQIRQGAAVPVSNPLPGPALKKPPKQPPDRPPVVPGSDSDAVAGSGCLPDSPYDVLRDPWREKRIGYP